ncbi:hypothetical protein J6590_003715 [Homalodisca vitripennis]|nr:hypothetical protein J6590_003715 [Homalodisca vitripennis]
MRPRNSHTCSGIHISFFPTNLPLPSTRQDLCRLSANQSTHQTADWHGKISHVTDSALREYSTVAMMTNALLANIRSTVMRYKGPPTIEEITELEKKLAICRNPMNNPTSKVFKQRMMEYALESYGQ